MSKTLFQELNDQFQSGEGFVVAKFEVKGQNENNLELELNGTRYTVNGDAIMPIDAVPVEVLDAIAPVAAETEDAGNAEIKTDAHGNTELHAQVDASQGGSDVVLSDGNATEAPAVADGNSAPAAAETEHPADVVAAPLAPATEGDVLPEVSGHAPADSADQKLIDDMVATVLTHFGAHDLDPTGEEEHGATVFVLKDVAGEEVARGTLSALHDKATAPVAPPAE